jgi:serine/threonine protein kinase/formylglycine-generating enzyme required for sulfatase activity
LPPPDLPATLTLEFPPSLRFGRYRVTGTLGAGGFGTVYRGYDDELQREVAIKVAHPSRLTAPHAVHQYLTEGRILAGLDHPGIVPVHDVGRTEGGLCYLVSKFIPGGDLAARLQQGKMPAAEAARLIATAAEALHHAHQRGLVHRDIKPANVLLGPEGRPILADFGLALREEDFGKGPTGAGTPPYMSPEQARQEGHLVDGRSDVYSLGVVLYELVAGQRPFRADDRAALLEMIKTCEPRPLRQHDDTVSKELDRICLKALSKRVSDRYSTARDLAEDLHLWLAEQQAKVGSGPPSPAGPAAPPSPSESSRNDAGIVPKGLRSFDGGDADFFLRLLPGPYGRDGLPESVRFWKARLDETDPDRSFRVGLLYGPSGCGKSSLVKAGLLPRLAGHVLPVYAEATPDDTEARLVRGLQHHWPDLPAGVDLPEVLARLRRGDGPPAGRKVVLVLDQFEQWLHAHQGEQSPPLLQALRQCDGRRLQALVLVRDDFWMSATRFMRDLEVPLLEGQNSAAVDLFDPRHARKVLAGFGRAFAALAEGPPTPEQERFLDRAVAELAQQGKVNPVRLALFAEMVKGKPWVPATLRDVGGIEGLGVTFLEETFSAPTAPPEHRLHQHAARAVLGALLPGPGCDLKGQMQSAQDLRAVSGYPASPGDFEALLHILDAEVRLVTPTEREAAPADAPDRPAARQYYQLSHDYLIEPLRHWLTAKQRETRSGRAALLLAERAALWAPRADPRQLPTWWEWVNVLVWVRPSRRGETGRRLMAAATRYYALRGLLAAGILVLVVLAGLLVRDRLAEKQRIAFADGLVDRLLVADIDQVPQTVASLDGYRTWTDPELARVAADPAAPPKQRLRASLALVPVDPGQVPGLYRALLEADPDDFLVIRGQLAPHAAELAEPLWRVVEDGQAEPSRRLRAGAALAAYAADDERWQGAAGPVTGQLVKESALHLRQWLAALQPVRQHLLPHLADVYRGKDPAERPLATSALGHYFADRPAVLIDLVKDADTRQYLQLIDKLTPYRDETVAAMTAELNRTLPGEAPPAAREELARRQANAAVTLFRLGERERVWPLFRHSADPARRSFLIHSLKPLGADPVPLAQRWSEEQDVSSRRALLLCLGEFGDRLPAEVRAQVLRGSLRAYREDPDPGIHSTAEWLLRTWNAGDLAGAEADLKGRPAPAGRTWLIDGQGHTLVEIDGTTQPVELSQGKRVNRSFAVATKEVTVEQFLRFRAKHPYQAEPGTGRDRPVNVVSWYDAAAYCRWLSEEEKVPENQMCYPPVEDIKSGMKPYADYLSRTGYRLPTEPEWELACRAGTWTSRFCGEPEELLPHYAWFAANSGFRLQPVGRLKPNDFGMFDMLGNAMEWCHESAGVLPKGGAADVEDLDPVRDDVWRVARGTTHHQREDRLRASQRDPLAPTTAWYSLGFRVARTVKPAP